MRTLRTLVCLLTLVWSQGCLEQAAPESDERLAEHSSALSETENTQSGDELRTGWYPNQPGLSPEIVSGPTFGKIFSASVEGQVYAQPLVDEDIVLVATESNFLYGLDAETGDVVWSRSLGKGWNPSEVNCPDLTPTVGITGTPVIDRKTHVAYLFSKRYRTGESGEAVYYAHAVDVRTGTERPGFPVEIKGNASNDPSRAFVARTHLQRPGLLLMDGVVYAAFGAHCDRAPWSGWIIGITSDARIKTMWSAQSDPSQRDGAAIWQSGGGIVSDGRGQMIITTGNAGAPKGPIPGKSPPKSLSQSVVRVAVQPDGTLKATDFFAPYDARQLDGWDADLGSGAPVALPSAYFGTPRHPNLLVQSGKQGYVYLLDRDDLGGIGNGPNGGDAVLGRYGPYGGVWSSAAVWPGDGGYVILPTASGGDSPSGGSGNLRVYRYGVDGSEKPTLSLAGTSTDAFGFGTGAPVVTSVGTQSGSALLWIVWSPDGSGGGAQLRAYDPVPVNGVPRERFRAPIGRGTKFAAPGIGNGRIYVGTRDGHVVGFGAPTMPMLSGDNADFGQGVIGVPSTRTVRVTAHSSLTLQSVTSSLADFRVERTTPALPASLSSGDTLELTVTFRPSAAGLRAGALTFTASAGGGTSVALSGIGLSERAELGATPQVVSFGGIASQGQATSTITFTNRGGAPLTITRVRPPAAPFGVAGAPGAGSQLAGGASVVVTVSFAPSALGAFTSALALETSAGTVEVPLSGASTPPGDLAISRSTIQLGQVSVGSVRTAAFTLENRGGSRLTLLKSKPPSGGQMSAVTSLPEGTVLAPGASRTLVVRFAPTQVGSASDAWTLNTDDAAGVRSVRLEGTAIASAPADLTKEGSIIARITRPGGGGSADLEVVRDGVFPPIGSSDDSAQYDTYTGATRTEDWVGYQYPSARTFGSLLFQEGKHFHDGGWLTSMRVQVRKDGSWVDVSGTSVAPSYESQHVVSYETYQLSFTPISGDAIRLLGVPGGAATFFSIGELRVFAGASGVTPEPGPPPSVDEDITKQGSIIALVTLPSGGGSRDLETIRDGIYPVKGSTDSREQYDTYTGTTRAEDWIGYAFSAPQSFHGLIFQEGKQFWDGGWFKSLGVQVRQTGVFRDVTGVTVTPTYAGDDGASYETYRLRFPAVSGDAIRLVGAPGGAATFISVGELRVLGKPL